MRRDNELGEQIIVKRRTKRGHEVLHSGAWKVAFADFTLAMMALFMVLWIIQPQADEERMALKGDGYETLFDGGAGIFDGLSAVPLENPVAGQAAQDQEADAPWQEPVLSRIEPAQPENSAPRETAHYDTEADLQALARLMNQLAARTDAMANIEVQVVPQGLRILIKDDARRFMFERGSATINPHFRTLLVALAQELGKIDNKLIISGHTDATPYRGKREYDNWNLSGERALQARGVMVAAGLPAKGVLQVSAQADVMPLRPDEPLSGLNRRIELLLLTHQAEALYRQLFAQGHVSYAPSRVEYIEAGGKRAVN
ncbi:OmpA family protein [Pseudomonas fragi]|uniref:OmpA family protein n=1 Tax=Pseudomonas fragi TaxID=296 RepID=UPI00380608E4